MVNNVHITQRAIAVLKVAMDKELMLAKFYRFFKVLMVIQKRMKGQIASRYGKVEVLQTYWEKMIWSTQILAMKFKDEHVTEILRKIMLIPEKVQVAALKKYISKARWAYAIAFFQWRFQNENTVVHNIPNTNKKEDLAELMLKYQVAKSKYIESYDQESHENKISAIFLYKYEMMDEEFKPFLINSFAKIGLTDPFPRESKSMSNEEDIEKNNSMLNNAHELIYSKQRIHSENSPYPIYIPNRAMMFKIMRACIGITRPEDLWFNEHNIHAHIMTKESELAVTNPDDENEKEEY